MLGSQTDEVCTCVCSYVCAYVSVYVCVWKGGGVVSAVCLSAFTCVHVHVCASVYVCVHAFVSLSVFNLFPTQKVLELLTVF